MRNRHFFGLDAVALCVSVALALTVRFEGWSWIGNDFLTVALAFSGIMIPVRLVLYWAFGLYARIWSLASVAELERILITVSVAGVISVTFGAVGLVQFGLTDMRMPLSVLALDALISGGLVAYWRIGARFSQRRRERRHRDQHRETAEPTLIVGAGAAGQLTARELMAKRNGPFHPVGFLDDDALKHGKVIGDLKVLGGLKVLPLVAKALNVRHVIIAMPSAPGDLIRSVVRAARTSGLEARIVPSLHEHITRGSAASPLREVRIEDLLRRKPVKTNVAGVRAMIRERTVMVTGAGGSIGSELCRQIAVLHPEQILLVGKGENSIFEIHQEFNVRFPEIRTVPLIQDVRDVATMQQCMERFSPAVVFHAAAHKHVPLMEANVSEALRNNVLGTQSVVDAAIAAGVSHLVLVSTDKAVRPTSIMGASKRIAEQVVQIAAQRSGNVYLAVRFGNVLGSRGSVVPTFMRQIRAGGPVLVTHPEMRRYFMTIPEAVQLVLQAFAQGKGGDVFCLNMGEPVRIVDLAHDLIQLSGLEPGVDIEVRFTGARPGEKLYEEMFFGSELAAATEHPKVLRSRHVEIRCNAAEQIETLLHDLAHGATDDELRAAIPSLVEDFCADPAPPLRVRPGRTVGAGVYADNVF